MYLADIQRALIETAHRRVRAGELSERGLARLCGMSQPHLHNVLKNIRALSTDSADRLMRALNLSTEDLLWAAVGGTGAGVRTVPVARNRIGPGFDSSLGEMRGAMPFPATLVVGLIDPVAARLAPDLVMPKALAANDLVLLDQNPAVRANPQGAGTWVVFVNGILSVRYLRRGGTLLYVANEQTLKDPARWQAIPLARQNILDVVRARIVWFGREIQEEPSRPSDPPGDGD
jgi:hypothetical protein